LAPADRQRLAMEFEGVDTHKMGDGEGERLLQLADRLITESSHALSPH
jgi:hypothetical protein